MAETEDLENKPDNEEINRELFQQSAELRQKSVDTANKLEELRRRTQELLRPDKENQVNKDS